MGRYRNINVVDPDHPEGTAEAVPAEELEPAAE